MLGRDDGTRNVSDTEDAHQAALRRCLSLRAAREACAAAPNAPAAHYAMGEMCTALGDDAGAVAAFADALRRAPGWADAWVNLGLARYRQGAMGAAKQAMREALRAAPGHCQSGRVPAPHRRGRRKRGAAARDAGAHARGRWCAAQPQGYLMLTETAIRHTKPKEKPYGF
jgi:predicted Zn-dependent protease